ncbi:glycosyltransferase family 1 protein [Mariniflexile sp.]|uniref:glycosyltransferase family 1 protein n=1 Tax=Mariniflexile sp. TaxID=1979402 RepID=UPI0035619C8B
MEKPIRILQILTVMNRGGAETMVMNYYRHIDRTKVQFDFLLHRQDEGVFDQEIHQLGGNIFRLQNISLKNLLGYQKSLDEFFQEHSKYKIVHSHLNALSFFVLKAAKKHNIPVRIAHSHTSLHYLNLNPFSKERHSLSFIFKFFTQNIFKLGVPKYANHYYACGITAGKWLFGNGNIKKVKIINNAIDASQFIYNPNTSISKKKELGVENKLVIGHVGNFVVEKNHAFLLDIFYEFKKLKEDCKLILVGGGDATRFRNKTKELGIDNDVLFLGVRSDVKDILQAMDIFVFPSTNEGLPVTLIEAQASGLKILASSNISKELKVTDLVDFVSLEESAKYWAKLVLDSLDYNRNNTFNKIIEGNYDIKNNASMLQHFYQNSLNE